MSLAALSTNITEYEQIDFEGLAEDLAKFSGDELVEQALQRGVDLKKYSEILTKDLKAAEMDCVTQYVQNSEQVSELHSQIQDCDVILSRMQDMLLSFQGDLSGISEEIKHLQNESMSMNVQLKNKRAVEERLSSFVKQAIISPDLVDCILSPHVDDQFLHAVMQLNSKLVYLTRTTVPEDGSCFSLLPNETTAGKQLLPDMQGLKIKSVNKARDFFTTQITSLRKNKTNIQVIQQNALLKYSPLFHFLQKEKDAPHIADDLRNLYIDTMCKIVTNVFKNYYTQLVKMDVMVATKSDMLVIEESAIKSVFTQKISFNKDKSSAATDTFTLGERASILTRMEAEPILLHVAQAEGAKFPYEVIMRSVLKHLVDASCSEFLFVLEFFQAGAIDIYERIFGKALSSILENLENYLLGCHDTIGLILLVKVTHALRNIMQRRRIAVLGPFFERIVFLVTPRLYAVINMNISSLKQASSTSRSIGTVELAPLYVSKRYAELMSSIYNLTSDKDTGAGIDTETKAITNVAGSAHGIDMSTLYPKMMQLRAELVSLLHRLAHTHFMKSKDQRVFFINNYDKVLSCYEERKVDNEESRHFENLLLEQKELFAEDEVKGAFPRLVSFVTQTELMFNAQVNEKDSEDAQEASASASPQLDEGIVETLVKDFSGAWRGGIQQINDDVLAYFANFRNGMEILKQVLTQLLLYYTRFQDIIKRAWSGRAPAFTRDIVSTATIMMEIKRYNRVI